MAWMMSAFWIGGVAIPTPMVAAQSGQPTKACSKIVIVSFALSVFSSLKPHPLEPPDAGSHPDRQNRLDCEGAQSVDGVACPGPASPKTFIQKPTISGKAPSGT